MVAALAARTFLGQAVAVAPAKASSSRARVVPVRASLYPEWGTYPGGTGISPLVPDYDPEKNAQREIIHGRFAMLGVTGAVAAENGTGIPWFKAGEICTPDDCTGVLFPDGADGRSIGPANFWAVLAIEVVTMGLAEAYRTGLIGPAFPELPASDVAPGGRFDPLDLSSSSDIDELKLKELKHCRLAMLAWLGCINQAFITQEGPVANLKAHLADPVFNNLFYNGTSLYQ